MASDGPDAKASTDQLVGNRSPNGSEPGDDVKILFSHGFELRYQS